MVSISSSAEIEEILSSLYDRSTQYKGITAESIGEDFFNIIADLNKIDKDDPNAQYLLKKFYGVREKFQKSFKYQIQVESEVKLLMIHKILTPRTALERRIRQINIDIVNKKYIPKSPDELQKIKNQVDEMIRKIEALKLTENMPVYFQVYGKYKDRKEGILFELETLKKEIDKIL